MAQEPNTKPMVHPEDICLSCLQRTAEKPTLDKEVPCRHRTLLGTLNVGVYTCAVEHDGRFIEVNRAMVEMFGYDDKEDLLGTRISDLYQDPADADRFWDRLLKERTIRSEELDLKRKDGTPFVASVSVVLVKDGKGAVRYCDGVIEDITERKLLERRLEKRQLYLESVLTCAPDGIVTFDEQHRIIEWNEGAEQIFGYTRAEVLGGHIDELIAGADAKVYDEAVSFSQMVLGNQALGPTETVRYRKDNTPVNVTVAGAPIFVRNALVGVVAVYTDIDQRKRAEEQVRQRTAQLEALREVGLRITSELDLDVLLESIVSRAVDLLNAASGGLYLYRPESDVLEWVLKVGPHPASIGTQLQRGEGLSGRVWVTGKPLIVSDYRNWEGRAAVYQDPPAVAVVTVPIRWGDSFLGVLNVVTEPPQVFSEADAELLSLFATHAAIAIENARLYQQARCHADELAHAVARLRGLDRCKSEFVQNVSHELRTPLALIRGYAEMLHMGDLGELRADQREPVAVIARRSRMLGELVQDITLILEIELNPPQPEPVLLCELAQVAVEDFQLAAKQTGVSLETEISPDLPPVRGGHIYLRRVLDNLIGNALKFTPEGGRITLSVRQEGAWITLNVSDTGIGIPADQLERIFERFYQVDGSSKRRYSGVGLGLALTKELVEAYGGEVTVQSQVGLGSIFTVRLLPYSAGPVVASPVSKSTRQLDFSYLESACSMAESAAKIDFEREKPCYQEKDSSGKPGVAQW